jgi:hydroxyacylglutathione hydrolase
MNLIALPAFSDNYIWLLHDSGQAVVVDPGDSAPVLAALGSLSLTLAAILVTHHHADHTGGLADLVAQTACTVHAPAFEAMPVPCERHAGGDRFELLGQDIQVLDVPGHTAGHVAYFLPHAKPSPILFCGDTLFSGGCGRLFEGTPAQMLASLDALSALPGDTRVCCAHEYTLSNLAFAGAVEPGNAQLTAYVEACQALRQAGQPTLPSSIALERQINPFLRSRERTVTAAVQGQEPSARDEVAVFAALREWKNRFR